MLPVACSGADQPAQAPASAQPSDASAPAQTPPAANTAGMVTGPADAPYRIKCEGIDPDSGEKLCLVDKATYVGWRTFHSTCFVCHGPNALGSTFAPNLVERLKEIDKARFMNSVQ